MPFLHIAIVASRWNPSTKKKIVYAKKVHLVIDTELRWWWCIVESKRRNEIFFVVVINNTHICEWNASIIICMLLGIGKFMKTENLNNLPIELHHEIFNHMHIRHRWLMSASDFWMSPFLGRLEGGCRSNFFEFFFRGKKWETSSLATVMWYVRKNAVEENSNSCYCVPLTLAYPSSLFVRRSLMSLVSQFNCIIMCYTFLNLLALSPHVFSSHMKRVKTTFLFLLFKVNCWDCWRPLEFQLLLVIF